MATRIDETVKMTEDQFQAEAFKQSVNNKKLKEHALNVMRNTPVGAKLEETANRSYNRALNGAWSLYSATRHMKESGILREDTAISGNYTVKPEFVQKIARFGGANSNRPEWFPVWALQSNDDALYVISRTRGKSVRGATAGENIYETKRPQYSSERTYLTVGTGDGATTTFTPTLSQLPARPFHVEVLVGGAKVANDDGAGGFVSDLLNTTTSTVDYTTTGNVNLVFLTAPDVGDVIEIVFAYDSENQTAFDAQLGDVELDVAKKRFNAILKPLGYSFHKFAAVTTQGSGLWDSLEEELVMSVGEEHIQREAYESLARLKNLALQNPIVTFDTTPTSAGDDNTFNRAQTIMAQIGLIEGAIYDDIKRGGISWGVAGQEALAYLTRHTQFRADDSQPRIAGSWLAGYLGSIPIYRTPSDSATVSSKEIMFNFKSPTVESDSSLIYGQMASIVSSLTYESHRTFGTVSAIEDAITVTPKYARLLRITGDVV